MGCPHPFGERRKAANITACHILRRQECVRHQIDREGVKQLGNNPVNF
jgi:hypothetical protein